jgi:hypothetical protein
MNLELPLHDLGSINTEGLRHTVRIVQSEHGVAAHVAVAVVQVLLDRLDQRLQKLEFFEFGDKAKSAAANKLVGMHEVLAQEVADENHFFSQFSCGRVGLVHSFEVHVSVQGSQEEQAQTATGLWKGKTYTSFLSSWSSKGTQ